MPGPPPGGGRLSESGASGAPESPPASPAWPPDTGRVTVVLVQINPASPVSSATSTTASTASGARSGAIFRKSGLPGATSTSRCFTAPSNARSCSGSWSWRSPGVLGELAFTTR